MRRLLLPAALAALLLTPAGALAKNGVTPVSPQGRRHDPGRRAAVFKLDVSDPGNGVFVQVCRSRRKDGDGVICSSETIGRAKHKRGSRFEYKAKLFDYPGFWLNTPGTYFWQAYRTDCGDDISDCKAEGPVVKFKVG